MQVPLHDEHLRYLEVALTKAGDGINFDIREVQKEIGVTHEESQHIRVLLGRVGIINNTHGSSFFTPEGKAIARDIVGKQRQADRERAAELLHRLYKATKKRQSATADAYALDEEYGADKEQTQRATALLIAADKIKKAEGADGTLPVSIRPKGIEAVEAIYPPPPTWRQQFFKAAGKWAIENVGKIIVAVTSALIVATVLPITAAYLNRAKQTPAPATSQPSTATPSATQRGTP